MKKDEAGFLLGLEDTIAQVDNASRNQLSPMQKHLVEILRTEGVPDEKIAAMLQKPLPTT